MFTDLRRIGHNFGGMPIHGKSFFSIIPGSTPEESMPQSLSLKICMVCESKSHSMVHRALTIIPTLMGAKELLKEIKAYWKQSPS